MVDQFVDAALCPLQIAHFHKQDAAGRGERDTK